MNEEIKEQRRKCFIITPIGNESSEIFRKAKGVIDSVIKPVLEKYGFDDIKPAYEIVESGMISNQIIDRIINDDLVVANLTGNNPNVMYELAIRHAVAKPIIHICENGTVLPFDIKDNRTIFYADDMLGVQELNTGLQNFITQINYLDEYRDNPIYNAMKNGNLFRSMNDEGRETEATLLQTILNEVSSLKVNNSTVINNYVDEDKGYFEIMVNLYNTPKDIISKFEKIIEKDLITLAEINNVQDNTILKLTNNKICYKQEIIAFIQYAVRMSKVEEYTINNIRKKAINAL